MNRRGVSIVHVPPSGKLVVDDLFCDYEQPMFDFYERNAGRYKTALDVGANVGVHTVLMARQGWTVHAFEPDPETFVALAGNVLQNDVLATLHEAALGPEERTATFVRVMDNRFASGIEGYKDFYGPRETMTVQMRDARPWFEVADFAKIDAEGAEADLVRLLPDNRVELLVEISNKENARVIFNHAALRRYGMWRYGPFGWEQVFHLPDLPTKSSDGMLFVGREAP